MKKLTCFWLIAIGMITLWGCSDSGSTGPDPDPGGGEQASSQKNFVYDAMNDWYYWQKDVPELADDYFNSNQDKQDYLLSFTDAEGVFNDLLYMPNDVDIYSFFIDDYEEFENSQDGITAATGLRYGFRGFSNSDKVVGYVRYVVEGSPADQAGLKRFDVFTEVDGTALNTSNFFTFLSDGGAHDLQLADVSINSNNEVSFTETNTVSVGSVANLRENPIYRSSVVDTNGVKIGYLMLNAFQGNSHEDLNDAFGNFKAQNIDELVLDLRYNGGGAVITSQVLSSMISGLGETSVFADFTYNDKQSANNTAVYFFDEVPVRDENNNYSSTIPMNKFLQGELNRVYVLTTSSTASASETTINSLLPYGIEIVQIGRQTEGKDVGSITLYDAPPEYSNKTNINPDHKEAIQPIVVKINNADGNAYPNGFTPQGDNRIDESSFTILANDTHPDLGDTDEVLFNRAISLILGTDPTTSIKSKIDVTGGLEISKELNPARNTQYIEPHMLPKN